MTYMEFGSLEEMLAYQAEAEKRANEMVVEEQRAISPGDYWCRPVPEMGLFEFGRVATEAEVLGLYSEDEEESPEEYWARLQGENRERGYRFSKAYSLLAPEGEWGDTHVLNMWPISEEDFHKAASANWDVVRGLGQEWVEGIMKAAQEAKRRQRKASSIEEPMGLRLVETEEEDDA